MGEIPVNDEQSVHGIVIEATPEECSELQNRINLFQQPEVQVITVGVAKEGSCKGCKTCRCNH